MDSQVNSNQTFGRKKLNSLLPLPGNRSGGNTSQLILWDILFILIKKTRHYKKVKLQTNISHEYTCKESQHIISKLNQQCIKRITHNDLEGFTTGM